MPVMVAFKAALDPFVGGRVFTDDAPLTVQFPYITMQPEISNTIARISDGRVKHWLRELQVDIWQRRSVEDSALLRAVVNALDGLNVGSGYRGCRVRYSTRLLDTLTDDSDVVQHSITVQLIIDR